MVDVDIDNILKFKNNNENTISFANVIFVMNQNENPFAYVLQVYPNIAGLY